MFNWNKYNKDLDGDYIFEDEKPDKFTEKDKEE